MCIEILLLSVMSYITSYDNIFGDKSVCPIMSHLFYLQVYNIVLKCNT